jgi:hypothetical protein
MICGSSLRYGEFKIGGGRVVMSFCVGTAGVPHGFVALIFSYMREHVDKWSFFSLFVRSKCELRTDFAFLLSSFFCENKTPNRIHYLSTRC